MSKDDFYISRYESVLEGNDILVRKKGATVWVNKTQEEFKIIRKAI